MNKYPSRVVEDRHGKGKALAATRDLDEGVRVEKFEGPVIPYGAVPQDMICHAIYVGVKEEDDQWVVSTTDAIRANHSCDPNCRVDDELHIVTIRPVKKDEELTFSYNHLDGDEKSLNFFWDHRWDFECKCGSPNCQKKIDRYV